MTDSHSGAFDLKTVPFLAPALQCRDLPTRRRILATLAGSVAALALPFPSAQHAQAGEPFSFDALTDRMREAAAADPVPAERVEGFIADLSYDGYQRIQFRTDASRWQDPASNFRVQAFHLGWLFEEPVRIYEVQNGTARPMTFSTADFEYRGDLADQVPVDAEMPGVAGFRLLNPLNSAERFDELVAFLGASYFRALGRNNVYGISARGLAVNTALSGEEEFPRFTAFWLERPALGATEVIVHAALESPSVTGAYRFVIRPGEDTTMEVTARIFLRSDIRQLGIAPLTSMFMWGGADPDATDDFRTAVHDSEYLIVNTRSGDTRLRALNNPDRLANSYLSLDEPRSFGLIQRSRDFSDYLDAEAHYEGRPSLMVEPVGDWGQGSVRLIEIPSNFEGNDNIVAFWVPEAPTRQGDEFEISYRLRWGMNPPGGAGVGLARVIRTRSGVAGVAGAQIDPDMRKFVIDFEGGVLAEPIDPSDVRAEVGAIRGEIVQSVLSRISGSHVWRMVLEVRADRGSVVELRAAIAGFDRNLSETWLYQWVRE
ncbi:MAG: glucan biosynthesis protein [Pararhodobacter sp.]